MSRFDKGDLVCVHLARSPNQLYIVTDVRREVLGGSALRMEMTDDGWKRVHVEDQVRDEILIVSHDLAHITWIDSSQVDLVCKSEKSNET